MTEWNTTDAHAITAAQEVQVITRRKDGSLRRPTTIWIVGSGQRVFIRSTNGRSADWFRHALATGSGRLTSRGVTYEVRFAEADDEQLPTVDAAYRAKYRSYASIVDHLIETGPRAATLEITPASPTHQNQPTQQQ